jgi:hypothetical protein
MGIILLSSELFQTVLLSNNIHNHNTSDTLDGKESALSLGIKKYLD